MTKLGWQRLIPPANEFRGEGKYRIDAYSEFLPAPRVGWKPYGDRLPDGEVFADDDPFGWKVSEFEEAHELQPGLLQVGRQVMRHLQHLLAGDPYGGLPESDLRDNPYWPPELRNGIALPHERCVTLLPLGLSRTQDDKGRVRWTLFGNSDQGPGHAFWKGFFTAPNKELPRAEAIGFFSRLLRDVYGESIDGEDDLRRVGFRILPDEPPYEEWHETLPSWTTDFLLSNRPARSPLKYLLTFMPFERLPPEIRKAYRSGKLCLLPFPGSLIYWGISGYHQLRKELPHALQIPLIHGIARHRMPIGLRVPQAGFFHERDGAHLGATGHDKHIRNTYKRTHRWDKILRDADELALIEREDHLLHVLFSSIPDDVSLYDKPMARNVQIWTVGTTRLLLDGPDATPEQIKEAMRTVQAGGLFGYRFLFPAMRVGRHDVYWHRPLVAYRDKHGETRLLPEAPLGYLTAADHSIKAKPIELWPRLRSEKLPLAALDLRSEQKKARGADRIAMYVHKLLDAFHKLNRQPIPRTLAQSLIAHHHGKPLDAWLRTLPDNIAADLTHLIDPVSLPLPQRRGAKIPDSFTYRRSATRAFEIKYWKAIASLSEGTFLNKNNADCVRDDVTRAMLPYHERHLEGLGDYLLAYYDSKIDAAGLTGKAMAGEIPFRWRTDFDYSWMGGWLKNQDGAAERDLVMVIPGRDRGRAVIMSDHYDTAYMADRYYEADGGCGARIAACGADDNHSATAAMMLAAPIFLEMSKAGKLGCDIWLIHLTGEEFPADCLGARALTQRLVEGTLRLHLPAGKEVDLSGVRVQGLYVSDMIAHNNDRDRNVFQISPGADAASFRLAEQAHIVTEVWNASVPVWNQQPERAGRMPGRRSPHGGAIPEIAPMPILSGEVRTPLDPRSTLYNTDGQIFSDAGVPCVLFMENYDINRSGYHDTHDTMANIDLDYGAAVCAITIESVARAAMMEEFS